MILQALNRYYDILLKDEDAKTKIPPFGYSVVGIGFALNISANGDLLDVLPMFEQENIPRLMMVPEYAEPTSNIQASFLCGKSDYVLGFAKNDEKNPDHSLKRFAEFQKLNKSLLKEAESDAAEAVINFLDKHNPKLARKHAAISPYITEFLKLRRSVFMYQGEFVHNDRNIKRVWETHHTQNATEQMQCLVTGEFTSTAIKHRKIQGKIGKSSFSSPLVSFNQRAFESYNRTKKQGLNSPVSEKAEFAYTTVLNYLLSSDNPNKKFYLGDAALIYWAESESRASENAFASFVDPSDLEEAMGGQAARREAEHTLETVAEKVTHAKKPDLEALLESLDNENPRFYVLGLAPVGDGRLLVRFFLTDLFLEIAHSISAHYDDSRIVLNPEERYDWQPKYISIKHIANACLPRNVKDKDKQYKTLAPIISATFRAILSDSQYPASLYFTIMNRIRAEADESDKRIFSTSYVRIALIKAYLIRKYRHQENPFKEVLTMALNQQSTIPAYLLGRLFAVLEDAQKEAAKPAKLNATIKDRYFTSACASPSSVFPVLLRLSQHHISKAEYGYVYDRRIQEIMQLLDVDKTPYPKRLSLDKQGIFVLGYYHQRADFYKKSNQSEEIENEGEN